MGGPSRGGGGGGGGPVMPMGGGGMGGLFAGGMPQLKKTGRSAGSSETKSQPSSSPKPFGELRVCACVCGTGEYHSVSPPKLLHESFLCVYVYHLALPRFRLPITEPGSKWTLRPP